MNYDFYERLHASFGIHKTLDEILAAAKAWGFRPRDIMAVARRRRARAQGRRVAPARSITLRLCEDDMARPYDRCDSPALRVFVALVEVRLAVGAGASGAPLGVGNGVNRATEMRD